MLCRNTTCRIGNVPATRHMRWRYKNDPPGTRPIPVTEAHFCDDCAHSIRGQAEALLLDEPMPVQRLGHLELGRLHALAVEADDDQLTYEALTAVGLDGPEANFLSTLALAWPAILRRLEGQPRGAE
jgi:hypothetical protein